ncbi:stage III sporulation protein AE [Iocasia frigidifontis]|uniref:Stage III sporulation protein AE n=1 Tax=Iocasia fonsfrigidae TaxID=2682810 RepID=A0A8A7KL08_9FIRM|nr:stage III sporulation protein AE [Iocasia fonsfrigidae]QTL98532.1 stage III sporulation protein AE [Iocasia fonsfrigidae]
MNIVRILLVIISCLLLFALPSYAENSQMNQDEIILRQLNKLDINKVQQEVNKINKGAGHYLPELNLKTILLNLVKGNLELDWRDLLKSIIKYLGKEVTANLSIMGQIIILAAISAILNIFHDSFSSTMISNTSNMLIFMILAVMVLQSFHIAIDIGVNAVDNIVSFMQALLPVLLSLLVSMGAFTSAVVFNPLTYLIISLLGTIVKLIVLPMIFLSTVLCIVTRLNDEFSLSRLAGLFKEASMGLLGLILIIFTGGLLIQGGAAAVTDSLSLRTAKYLTGTFIPVIGGIFSDAVDLVVSCSLIIKNALNLFGMIAIIMIIAYPIIKLIALIIIYKLASALIQPIADARLVDVLNDVGNSLVFVFLTVSAVSLMFFITLTVIVGAANLTVMMR